MVAPTVVALLAPPDATQPEVGSPPTQENNQGKVQCVKCASSVQAVEDLQDVQASLLIWEILAVCRWLWPMFDEHRWFLDFNNSCTEMNLYVVISSTINTFMENPRIRFTGQGCQFDFVWYPSKTLAGGGARDKDFDGRCPRQNINQPLFRLFFALIADTVRCEADMCPPTPTVTDVLASESNLSNLFLPRSGKPVTNSQVSQGWGDD